MARHKVIDALTQYVVRICSLAEMVMQEKWLGSFPLSEDTVSTLILLKKAFRGDQLNMKGPLRRAHWFVATREYR